MSLRPVADPEIVVCLARPGDREAADTEITRQPGAAALQPLFPHADDRGAPGLATFQRVVFDDSAGPSPLELVERLIDLGAVTEAWLRPELLLTGLPATALPPVGRNPDPDLGRTPDFFAEGRQPWLGAADEGGINAHAAWSCRGGYGEGVQIIDVEREWLPAHEDLGMKDFVIDGTPSGDVSERNHGTNVVGVLAARHDGVGTRGVCPGASVRGVSIEGTGRTVATAIWNAANLLGRGDILLLEMQAPGPHAVPDADTHSGWIPIEFWPAEHAAIREAVKQGVIVVAAAGNGGEDLDSATYNAPPRGYFGGAWQNPFHSSALGSGAILVGAGAPPERIKPSYGPERSRLEFSNYGTRVDAQAWGYNVATTGGFGTGLDDLFPWPSEERWYTGRFSGTSSAAAIVAGALACVQGVLRAEGHLPLTPEEARTLLRNTGRSQENADGRLATAQRIGSRPDLDELIREAPRTRRTPVRPISVRKPTSDTGSKTMSAPTNVYNLYFGSNGAPAARLDPSRMTVSRAMDATQVDLTQVKGPGAIVVQIGEGKAVVIDLGLDSAPLQVDPAWVVGGLSAVSVDVTQVKGPATLATINGANGVALVELKSDG